MTGIHEELVRIIELEHLARKRPYVRIAEDIGMSRDTLLNARYRKGHIGLYTAEQILNGLGYKFVIRKKEEHENEEGKAEWVREAVRSFRC